MQVKRVEKSQSIPSGFEIAIDGARVFTGLDALEWARRGAGLGAGELCVNSIDCDGGCEGYDIELLQKICEVVSVPVIGSGGAGSIDHVAEVFQQPDVSARTSCAPSSNAAVNWVSKFSPASSCRTERNPAPSDVAG